LESGIIDKKLLIFKQLKTIFKFQNMPQKLTQFVIIVTRVKRNVVTVFAQIIGPVLIDSKILFEFVVDGRIFELFSVENLFVHVGATLCLVIKELSKALLKLRELIKVIAEFLRFNEFNYAKI
jgi:hypothetical protein